MSVKCPKCDSENPDTKQFCGDCGTQLTPSEQIPDVTKTIETPAEEYPRGSTFAYRYKIIEKLGMGGMGAVYRVEDTNIGQDIALKLIKSDIASDKKTIERFRNELKITRMISHRNVCRMFDLAETEGTSYITMEYVPGEDLKSFIRRSGKLDIPKAISIAKEVCEGLSEAHRLGVVHRDLKSSNIMIDKSGNARIMDFGIARSLKAKGITRAGAMIGTPEYISPEQVDGKDVDQRSDIYSLGVILYEMVTGSVPFDGETALSVAYKHKNEAPLDPRSLNVQIPEALNQIILKCLKKEKEGRHQSAEVLYAELNAIEKELPTTEKVAPKRKPFTSKEITVTFGLKRLLIPALAIIAIVVATVVIWQFLPQKEVALVPKIENSIAVISFDNQTGDEAFDYLQKIIPNLLITNLENTGFFHVATWERMRDLLKQMDKGDVDIINSELGFQACQREGIKGLALGSFAKVGETFVIDVKLLDVESKRLLKSASSRGEGEGSIFAQIDELSRRISEGMQMSQQKIEAAQLNISDVTTNSIEAYRYYLKGKEDWHKYYGEEARQSFEKAVNLDPEFALAYLYLAHTSGGEAREEAYEKAKTYSEKVTEKERLYIEAYYARDIERDVEKSVRILKQLTNKYPKEKEAYYFLALYYQNLTRNFDKALEEYNNSLELDPSYGPSLNGIGYVYYEMGNYQKAIECFKKYAALRPGETNPLDSLADAYFQLGRLEESVAKYKKALEIKPSRINSYVAISYINALKEDYSGAIEWAEQFIAIAQNDTYKAYVLLLKGFYFFWLGRMDQALGEIRQARVLADSAGNYSVSSYADLMEGFVYHEKGEQELALKSMKNYFDFRITRVPEARYKLVENRVLGQFDLKEGRNESAKARLVEMKSLFPEITEGIRNWYERFYNLLHAEVLLAEGSFEEAVAIGKKVSLKIVPHSPWNMIRLNVYTFSDVVARAYRKKGKLDKAIGEYERLMSIGPENKDRRLIHPMYHFRLATLYEQKGWAGKAIDQYEKFLVLWKDADEGLPEVEDARERLLRLKGQ